jgi:hypothetical protein
MLMKVHSRAARRALTVAAVGCGGALVAVLAAACGSQAAQSASSAPPAGSGSSTPSRSATPSGTKPSVKVAAPRMPATQCPTSALRVTVNKAKGSGAAGTSYVPVDFTNVSGHSCDMFGFPGVSFVTAPGGSQIGTPASRQTTFGSETVTLASGSTAHAWLGIADAGNFPASACQPVTAHWLKVYPPDQFAAASTRFTAAVCSKKITGGSTPLTVLPIRPGSGTPGTVP